MKTNFQMLKELLKVYHPEEKGIISCDESLLIAKTLCLQEMDMLALRNLRDFVVLFLSQHDNMENWDRMSAITYVIDMKIISKGGEV